MVLEKTLESPSGSKENKPVNPIGNPHMLRYSTSGTLSFASKISNLDSVLKSRDIILLTKIYIVKTVAFPVIMYGCESWTIRKAEHGRMVAFELWCWRRLLRLPWTARILT